MSDDRDQTKPRAKMHQGDVERTAIGRPYRTPARGIPVEIDPEATPAPQPVPLPDRTAGIDEQLRVLSENVNRNAVGLARMWDMRDGAAKLDAMQAAIAGVDRSTAVLISMVETFLKPAVNQMMGRLDGVEQSAKRTEQTLDAFFKHDWPKATDNIEALDEKAVRMQRDVDRHERGIEDVGKRIESARAVDERQEIRIRELEDFKLLSKTRTDDEAKAARKSTDLRALVISTVVALAGLAVSIMALRGGR